jgi:hypothetical protein
MAPSPRVFRCPEAHRGALLPDGYRVELIERG